MKENKQNKKSKLFTKKPHTHTKIVKHDMEFFLSYVSKCHVKEMEKRKKCMAILLEQYILY